MELLDTQRYATARRKLPLTLSYEAQMVSEQWLSLVCDRSQDEMSEGGQSLRELEHLEKFEEFLFSLDQLDVPTFHYFDDGIYIREIHAKADTVLIGHMHTRSCLNIMSKGKVLTIVNGEVAEFKANCTVRSGALTRKASIVVEDMVWSTIHANPDNETDIAKLEERHLIKSPTYLRLNKWRE